jgi:hypothetical protein
MALITFSLSVIAYTTVITVKVLTLAQLSFRNTYKNVYHNKLYGLMTRALVILLQLPIIDQCNTYTHSIMYVYIDTYSAYALKPFKDSGRLQKSVKKKLRMSGKGRHSKS